MRVSATDILCWNFERRDEGTAEGTSTDIGTALAEKRERSLICADCGHTITRESERIDANGAHEHGFINPSGLSFHIACYRQAPGCALVGEATEEHSWFPGHAWRIGLCGQCGTHLGWGFVSRGGDLFYGLITRKLAAPP